MNRYRPIHPAAVSGAVGLAAAVLLIVSASGVLGGVRGAPARRAAPSPSPVATPSPVPSDDASDGIDRVELENEHGVDSSVVVWDETDTMKDAYSGSPGRGATVAADELEVVSVDDDTLRLTWSDLPIGSQARASVRIADDGTWRVRVMRTRPQAPTDAIATDRVLLVDFHVAVPVEDVRVAIVDSMVAA